MQTFKATWSTTLHVVSWSATALCLITSVVVALAPGAGNQSLWGVVLPLALIAGCAPFTVRGYTITPDAILIHRLWWQTRLDRAGLESVTLDPDAFRWALRTCGNGGLFSFTGYYWSKRLGPFRAYVTNHRLCVVLRIAGKTVVMSPDDPEAFMRALQPG